MKKILLTILLIAVFLPFSGSGLMAREKAPSNFLTLSFLINPAGIGYKHQVIDNVYVFGNLDYLKSAQDLEFRIGSAYLIPRRVLLFKFYAGGGMQFSRNIGFQYPFVTVGTHFLFLYTEMIHPLQSGMKPRYRFGLNFKF